MSPAQQVGRNDPCPCGSGKKYKKCHMSADQQSGLTQEQWDDLSLNLTHKLVAYLDHQKFDRDFHRAFDRYFPESNIRNPAAFGEMEQSMFYDYFVHLYRMESTGDSIVGRYLEEHRIDVSPEERTLLEGRMTSRFSLFEIQRVDVGQGMLLKDLFQEDEFYVHEVSGSQTLYKWDVIVGNIYQVGEQHQLSGNIVAIPRGLVHAVQSSLLDEYRSYQEEGGQMEFQIFLKDRAYLIRDWTTETGKSFPQVVNKDGDQLIFGTAYYNIKDRSKILRELEKNPMFEEMGTIEGELTVNWGLLGEVAEELGYTTEDRDSSSIFGTLRFFESEMRVDVNSERRMAVAKSYLEDVFADEIQFLDEEFIPLGAIEPKTVQPGAEPPQPLWEPEDDEAIREAVTQYQKDYYYDDWIYHSIPMLGGLTPMQAYTEAPDKLDDLLRTIENQSERSGDFAVMPDMNELKEYIAEQADAVSGPEFEEYYSSLSTELRSTLGNLATDLFQITVDHALPDTISLVPDQMIAYRAGDELRLEYVEMVERDQVWVYLFERESHPVPREDIVAVLDDEQTRMMDRFIEDFMTQQELLVRGMAEYDLGGDKQALETLSLLIHLIFQMEDQIFYIVDEMSAGEIYFDLGFGTEQSHFILQSHVMLLNISEICGGILGEEESLENIRNEVTGGQGTKAHMVTFLCVYFAAIALYAHQHKKRLRNLSHPAFRGILDHVIQKKYSRVHEDITSVVRTMTKLTKPKLRELYALIKAGADRGSAQENR